ncbi:MAG: hypothetical protein ACRD68_00265 [Pyrinomonadaceae bacterium]
MEQVRDRKSAVNAEGGAEQKNEGRDAEATSGETLEEIEKKESTPGDSSRPGGSSAPSPDGAFDESRGGSADGRDTGGPM